MKGNKKILAVCMAAILLMSGCANDAAGKLTAEQIASLQRAGIGGTGELSQNGTMAVNATDEELRGMVYHFVSGNIRIDMNDLIMPSETEQKQIAEHIGKIISALKGKDNASISDDMLNYLLWEFSKTQKEWTLADNGIVLLGKDATTNRTFVDVTFKTTDNNKLQLPASNIIIGSPLEAAEKKLRKEEYLAYLDAWYAYEYGETMISSSGSIFSSSSQTNKDAAQKRMDDALATFEKHWGNKDYVLDEQQEWSMIERMREKIKLCDGTIPLTYEQAFLDSRGYTAESIKTNPPTGPLTSDDLRYVETRGVGTYTYPGIAGQVTFDDAATMTFRFVLDFKAHLGSAKTISTEGVYLRNYALDFWDEYQKKLSEAKTAEERKEIEKNGPLSIFTKEDIAATNESVVAPYVDRLINRFQKCIEENDYPGLYKLFGQSNVIDSYTQRVIQSTSRFRDWDKFYSDMGKYCYIKFDAYNYNIIGWQDNELKVLVTRAKKIRGKGTNMTMPTYQETSLLTVSIDNDELYVANEILLGTDVTGEPVSMLKDINGMAEKLAYSSKAFSDESKASVLGAIQKFSDAQLDFANAYTSNEANANILEFSLAQGTPGSLYYGITAENMSEMRKTMGKIATQPPTEKITHVITWATVSNSYCRLRLRELFIFGGNDAVVTEAYIGLTNTDGVWTVVSYDRTSAEYYNTSGQSVEDLEKGCLCHDFLGATPSKSSFESEDGVTPDQSAKQTEEKSGKVLSLEERASSAEAAVVTTVPVTLPEAPEIVTSAEGGSEVPVETTSGMQMINPGEVTTAEGSETTQPAETTAPVEITAPAETTVEPASTTEDPFGFN